MKSRGRARPARAQAAPVDRHDVVALAAGQVRRRRVAVLGTCGSASSCVEQRRTPAPQVVGDVRDRGAGQGRPAAAALHPRHPVAELVAGQPRWPPSSAPANRPSASAQNSPLLAASSTHSWTSVMPSSSSSTEVSTGARSPGVVSSPTRGDDHVGGPPPVGEVRAGRRARRGRRRRGRGEPLHDHRPATEHGAPDAHRRRTGAAGQRVPPRLGLPHGSDASARRACGTRPGPRHSGAATTSGSARNGAQAKSWAAPARGARTARGPGPTAAGRSTSPNSITTADSHEQPSQASTDARGAPGRTAAGPAR